MSNQTGDRYTCTDPACGCEIEIKLPCKLVDASRVERPGLKSVEPRSPSVGHFETASERTEGRAIRVSTPGDYGAQGATGEAIFGTTDAGQQLLSGEGRYGSDIRRAVQDDEASPVESGVRLIMVCFCGHEMREAGRSVSASRVVGR